MLAPEHVTRKAIDHVQRLHATGATYPHIAQVCGANFTAVRRLGQGEATRASWDTIERVFRIGPDDVRPAVDEEILRRLIHTNASIRVPFGTKMLYVQALAEHGWPRNRIAMRLSMSWTSINRHLEAMQCQ